MVLYHLNHSSIYSAHTIKSSTVVGITHLMKNYNNVESDVICNDYSFKANIEMALLAVMVRYHDGYLNVKNRLTCWYRMNYPLVNCLD